MKAIFPLVALTAMLAACAAPPRPAPAPKPVIVQPRPVPRPAPLPPSPADWRDAAQTPGNWRWAILADQSTAMFGNVRAGGADLMLLACDRQKNRVLLARAGSAPSAVPLAVTTTSMRRPLLSDPALGGGSWLVVPLAAGDPLLDAIAFSRGRFALETAGLETLYLPAWPEISRVVEDCRAGDALPPRLAGNQPGGRGLPLATVEKSPASGRRHGF